ncbi:unnamed protein product [Clavelina lepadiformis]|uniref:Protein smoothened n=1 Tax=Clavelina lepadiformis TaxID=159417 RepID=A0ABP0GEK7_CLALP
MKMSVFSNNSVGLESTYLGVDCSKNSLETCQSLNQSSALCFGFSLPYSDTSFELVTDASNLKEANEKLLLWSGLRAVPRCWDVIQPLLCSVYFPRCEDGKISLPDRSLCESTRGPCQIVQEEYGWPDFLQCDNNDVFGDNCKSPSSQIEFNKSDCELPLIATNNPASYYDKVEGCGLQCMNPLFDQAEHDEIHAFVAGWAGAACICTFFAMLSFFIDWKNSSKYPARIIFYINLCFFLGGIGWLAQFFSGAREEIVCRRDGTMRLAEPVGTGESPSCVIIFVLVYYFLMAGITWFDILSYSWFLMFKALGTHKDPLTSKAHRFHLTAWSIPFILMVSCLAVSQIDGDSMSGICFIGYKNYVYRLGFLLIPVGIVLLVGGFFLARGLFALFSIRKGHPGLLSDSAISKINWTMIRIGVFTVLAFVFVFITFAAHVYDYSHQALWEKSFKEYIKCEANVTILETLSGYPPVTCILKNHPNLSVLKLNLVALFGTGIVMSSWVWTKASFLNWRRAWYKLIGRSDNEMKRIRRRSKIIAKAFAIRNMLKQKQKKESDSEQESDEDVNGLEYSEHTISHQDPVGMDFDLHSVTQEMSSTWVRNVPKMVQRRGGILPEDKSNGGNANQHPVCPYELHRYYKNRDREKDTEPGLWAVSQYVS